MAEPVGVKVYKYFKKQWETHRNEPWSLTDIHADIGSKRLKDLIDYYFETRRRDADLKWFIYHYDELEKRMLARQQDRERRERLRAETRRRMEEHERRSPSN